MSEGALEGTPSRLTSLFRSIVHHLHGDAGGLPIEGDLPSFAGATSWLNSEPLTPEVLHGRVVLVQLWTNTCINWLRVQLYVHAWAEKSRNPGLVVIGVHAPELPYEHNLDTARRAAKQLRVAYPIAIDNDFATWRAINNNY
jgi:thiol-disulfide isomerase/thioredoxin